MAAGRRAEVFCLRAEEVDVRNHLVLSRQKRVLGRSGGEGKFRKGLPAFFSSAGYRFSSCFSASAGQVTIFRLSSAVWPSFPFFLLIGACFH